MQIVIDIPQGLKIDFENENWTALTCAEMKNALINGTPLPKGHGRLIDGDRFDAISYQHTSDDFDNGVMWLAEQIDNAPTIIEADKESEE